MKVYTLAGITKRGKQIIKQHGDRWECLGTRERVLFSDKRGPWLLVVPIDENRVARTMREAREDSSSRWAHAFTDDDFKVMP